MVPGVHAGGIPRRALRQGTVMSPSDQPPFLYATRIDIPLEIRAYLIALLDQTLACTVDLRSQVQHAAWNVKGSAFLQVRALFDAIALELDAHMQLVAARIIVLGGVVQGTVRTAATQSTLPEYPDNLMESDAHVRALAERVTHYAITIQDAIVHTTDVEDATTANIYTDMSRGIETRLGDLDTYLH
jgi:starvation-inducible DNA-binding protein